MAKDNSKKKSSKPRYYGDEFETALRRFKNKYRDPELQREVDHLLDRYQLWNMLVFFNIQTENVKAHQEMLRSRIDSFKGEPPQEK